ncbi:domain iii family protein [Stylonychia lemnae]|uniref:Domain iii family protein n=1 Tax=Stylonychia lemnae TaxID=5949 RepID=A0A077ZQV7_STYLE|nr:domain iii family protein [Stylonychia lemnae]|eukprot:CDW71809.1 domain iii family protein [Stylonychia lemnae]
MNRPYQQNYHSQTSNYNTGYKSYGRGYGRGRSKSFFYGRNKNYNNQNYENYSQATYNGNGGPGVQDERQGQCENMNSQEGIEENAFGQADNNKKRTFNQLQQETNQLKVENLGISEYDFSDNKPVKRSRKKASDEQYEIKDEYDFSISQQQKRQQKQPQLQSQCTQSYFQQQLEISPTKSVKKKVQFQGEDNQGEETDATEHAEPGPKYVPIDNEEVKKIEKSSYTQKNTVYCHAFGYAKIIDKQIKEETGISSPTKYAGSYKLPQDRQSRQEPFNSQQKIKQETVPFGQAQPNSTHNNYIQNLQNNVNQNQNKSHQTRLQLTQNIPQIKTEIVMPSLPDQISQSQSTRNTNTAHNNNNNNGNNNMNGNNNNGNSTLNKFMNQQFKPQQYQLPVTNNNGQPLSEKQKIGIELYNMHQQNMKEKNHILQNIRNAAEFQALPWFLQPDKILDMNKRRPGNPQYDPGTVYIPVQELAKFSPFLRQYWSLKQNHFDKILCFQKGKFYELYYIDALIGHHYLKIAWSGGSNAIHFQQAISCGIHENNLNKVCQEFIDLGFKVAVIEQAEDKREVDERIKAQHLILNARAPRTPDMLVKRQISGIFTKGILPYDPGQQDYEAKWILSLYVETRNPFGNNGNDKDRRDKIGVAFFDNTTLTLHLGQFEEDMLYSKFRTLLCQIRPREIIFDKENISLDIVKILKEQPLTPDLNNISLQRERLAIKYFGNDTQKWPRALQDYRSNQDIFTPSWISFAMIIMYLQNGLIADQVVGLSDIHKYDPDMQLKTCMEIDSQAIKQLELLEVPGTDKPKKEGSLFHYLDHTKTVFGRRLLKKWISTPLFDVDKINTRLDAVEDLLSHPDMLQKLQDKLKMLPDFDKECTNIYKLSTKTSMTLLAFEKLDIESLRDFYNLLEKIKLVGNILELFKTKKEKFKSHRLKALLTMKDVNTKANVKTERNLKNEDQKPDINLLDKKKYPTAIFPEIHSAIAEFEALIIWSTGSNGEKFPEPFEGFDADYDRAKFRIKDIEMKLDKHLQEVRQIGICQKFRKSLLKEEEDHLILNQSKHQMQLYVTELEDAEYNIKIAIMPFICSIFGIFQQKRRVWQQITSCLAELDCYTSLAIVAQTKPYLELKKMRHPCVNLTFVPGLEISAHFTNAHSHQKTNTFIPNDTSLGRRYTDKDKSPSKLDDKQPNILLLTGPNMGGKSTLLRQTCLAVILAQIGSLVPAEKCVLTPVDKVFTRLGASDKLLEKKSTFYVEMEETKAILDKATQNSLAVLDELGRGTSTYDGLSIADAVLNFLADKVGVCLYSFQTLIVSSAFCNSSSLVMLKI